METFTKGVSSAMSKPPGFTIKLPPLPPPRIPYNNPPENPPPTPHAHSHSTIFNQVPSLFTNPGPIEYFPSPDPSASPSRGPPDDSPSICRPTPQYHPHSTFLTKKTPTFSSRYLFVNFLGTLNLTPQDHICSHFATKSPSITPNQIPFDAPYPDLCLGYYYLVLSFFLGNLLLLPMGSLFEENMINVTSLPQPFLKECIYLTQTHSQPIGCLILSGNGN